MAGLPSPETGDLEKSRVFTQRYLAVLPSLLAHRARKAINVICDFVAPRDGKFAVVMFGDWNGGTGSPVSRRTCGPLQEIKFGLRNAHHVDLRSVDEFRTSQTCSMCHEALVNSKAVAVRYSRHAGTWEAKKTRCSTARAVQKAGVPLVAAQHGTGTSTHP